MEKLKRIIFYLIMILLTLTIVEIIAQTSYYIIFKERYSINNLLSHVKEKRDKLHRLDSTISEINHPYVGYVWEYYDREHNNRQHGFMADNPPVLKKEKDKLNVALVGGSVALKLGRFLENELKRASGLSPRIITLALGGYKQPQQLLALNYFIALGAEYEVIINVDGFNDIVLPIAENRKDGINPFFPRGWDLRLFRHEQTLSLWEKAKKLLPKEKEFVAGLSSGFGRNSAIYGMLNWVWFRKLNYDINKTQREIVRRQSKVEKSFEETGPSVPYGDVNQLYYDLAEVWARSSLLINNLASQNGTEYYHFLQPNQYYENSKELTEEEVRTAYNENHPYRGPAVIGYPIIINLGKAMLENKIRFFDATMLFADEKGTIYIDDCCHYNKKGNEIFSAYIISNILANTKIDKLKSIHKYGQDDN
ncbi:MAG: hypothetical protein AB1424_18775 [Thermodesulfobacteriota bacterium]